MNAVVSPRRFTQAELQKARAVAESARQPVVAVLEEQAGLEPDEFVVALGETLHYPTLTMYQLHQLKPAFDRVSFTEAMARECLVFSGPEGKGLIVVIGDPFNTGVLDWAESRVNQRFLVFIAHRSDIAAYMSRYEENLRAMDGMLPNEAAGERLSRCASTQGWTWDRQ